MSEWFLVHSLTLVAALAWASPMPAAEAGGIRPKPSEFLVIPRQVQAAHAQRPAGVHPRLLADAARFAELKQRLVTEPATTNAVAAYRKFGDALLDRPAVTWTDRARKHGRTNFLNSVARQARSRLEILSFCYRMTGDRRYAARAWQEIAATAAMKDWGDGNMLCVGELCFGYAIAYDWLFEALTPSQRETLRAALRQKGFAIPLRFYRGEKVKGVNDNFIRGNNNFTAVVNGGVGSAALAVMDDEPLAAEILAGALTAFNRYTLLLEPDGAGPEGPMYWNYAMRYLVQFLSALDSALGTDFGISERPSLRQTGTYALHVTGPSGEAFNYSDSGRRRPSPAVLHWLAAHYQEPALGWLALRPSPADDEPTTENAQGGLVELGELLWARPESYHPPTAERYPPARLLRGDVELAFFRSAWNDPNAWYVALKGGRSRLNHGHLDLGTFVLDALGERWAIDQGSGSYQWPGYFEGDKGPVGTRWTYYATRAEGHNTIVLNPDHEPDQGVGTAPFTFFSDQPGKAGAILDLSETYTRSARSTKRGVRLTGDGITVQDEIELKAPSAVFWSMHTAAEISLEAGGRVARLSQNGKTLIATCLSPAQAVFSVMPAKPLPGSPNPPENNSRRDGRKLLIALPGTSQAVIAVAFTHGGLPVAPPLVPLAAWR